MSNQDRAAQVLSQHWSVAQETGQDDECDCCAQALADAGLLMPDLPELEWPSLSVSDKSEPVSVETEDVTEESRTDLPRPEDVPAGEAWLVRTLVEEVNALKTNHPDYPWSVSSKPEFYGHTAYSNESVSLISRLVPEPEA